VTPPDLDPPPARPTPAQDDPPGGPLGFDQEEAERRWAHRRDPDLPPRDADEEPPDRPSHLRPPPGASRYAWFVGVVVVLVIATLMVQTQRPAGQGARGLPAGARLPAFAAPLAASDLEGDANIAPPKCDDRGACAVRGPRLLNSCQLAERGPSAVAFVVAKAGRCTAELDALARVRRRHPGVQVAAVAIRGDRGDLRSLVRSRGWGFPVAQDRDGAVANLFGVVACPQVTYALPGGRVTGTTVGEQGAAALDRRLRALERAARARGWRP
jgi:hypothetical protein